MNPIKNQGKYLEMIIDLTNQKYYENDIAVISKILTNIRIIKTNESLITKANFNQSINCDYIGLFQGRYIEFEAKETYKNVFDLNLLSHNQKEKLAFVHKMQGLAFLIIYFGDKDTFFLVDYFRLKTYTDINTKKNPYQWFLDNCQELFIDNTLSLNYLKYIDQISNYF